MQTIWPSFKEPFQQGWHNVYDGVSGTRAYRLTNTQFYTGPITENLSLFGRVNMIVIGIILLVPLVNFVALAFFKAIRCSYIEKPVSLPPLPPDTDPLTYSLRINVETLSRTPKPLDLAKLAQNVRDANPPPRMEEMFDHIKKLAAKRGERTNSSTTLSFTNSFSNWNYYVLKHDPNRLNRNMQHRYAAMKLLFQNIILLFRVETIPDERKWNIVEKLSEAISHCEPRQYEELLESYRILTNQEETPEEVLLEGEQLLKEILFKNYYTRSREPVMTMNFIRKQTGTILGLDCNEVNLSDPYMGLNDALSNNNRHEKHKMPSEFIQVFSHIYLPRTVVPWMKEYLNSRIDSRPQLGNDIAKEIDAAINDCQTKGILTETEVNALPEPYQKYSKTADNKYRSYVTDLGVKFLMVYYRRFVDLVPNGHLVRAPQNSASNAA